nr:hypothetical protein B11C_10109 [Bartonella sp. 1-1C]
MFSFNCKRLRLRDIGTTTFDFSGMFSSVTFSMTSSCLKFVALKSSEEQLSCNIDDVVRRIRDVDELTPVNTFCVRDTTCVVLPRPGNFSRCTLPITAFLLTPPN